MHMMRFEINSFPETHRIGPSLKGHYHQFPAKKFQIILLAVIDFELILFRPLYVLKSCIKHIPWRFSARNHF